MMKPCIDVVYFDEECFFGLHAAKLLVIIVLQHRNKMIGNWEFVTEISKIAKI